MEWFKGAYIAGVVIGGIDLVYHIVKDVITSTKPKHTIYNETLKHGKYIKEIYDDGKIIYRMENHPTKGKYILTKYNDGRKIYEYSKN